MLTFAPGGPEERTCVMLSGTASSFRADDEDHRPRASTPRTPSGTKDDIRVLRRTSVAGRRYASRVGVGPGAGRGGPQSTGRGCRPPGSVGASVVNTSLSVNQQIISILSTSHALPRDAPVHTTAGAPAQAGQRQGHGGTRPPEPPDRPQGAWPAEPRSQPGWCLAAGAPGSAAGCLAGGAPEATGVVPGRRSPRIGRRVPGRRSPGQPRSSEGRKPAAQPRALAAATERTTSCSPTRDGAVEPGVVLAARLPSTDRTAGSASARAGWIAASSAAGRSARRVPRSAAVRTASATAACAARNGTPARTSASARSTAVASPSA